MGDLESLLSELADYGDVSLISVATERRFVVLPRGTGVRVFARVWLRSGRRS